MSSEHLLVDCVINLREIKSVAGREYRFGQVISNYLERYPVTHLAVALPPPLFCRTPDIANQTQWLKVQARERRLPLRLRHTPAITRALLGEAERSPNLRKVAEHLSGLFPELWRKAPASNPVPGTAQLPELALRPRRVRPTRERYWSRMFLALAAAQLDLREHLLTKL